MIIFYNKLIKRYKRKWHYLQQKAKEIKQKKYKG